MCSGGACEDQDELAAELLALPAETDVEAEILECLREQDLEAAKQAEAPYGYCVSITRNGRHRKLHHVGSCRRVPGVDYKEFDCYGEVLPEAHELDSRCKDCFGTTSVLDPVVAEESEAESLDSSSSATSGEPGPKAPRAELVGE